MLLTHQFNSFKSGVIQRLIPFYIYQIFIEHLAVDADNCAVLIDFYFRDGLGPRKFYIETATQQ